MSGYNPIYTLHRMQFGFEHYLKAGHGRAYLMAGKEPERYRDAIMNACRKDYTFDIQCEGSRAFLTADLVDLFEDRSPFIDAAKDAFNSSQIDDVYNEIQYLSDFLMEFGQKKTVLKKYLALWEKIKQTPYSHLTERSSYLLFNVEYLAIKLVCDQPWKIAENIVKDMGAWYLTLDDDARSEFPWFYSVLEDEYGEDETREHLLKLAEVSSEAKAFCDKDLRKEPLSQEKVTAKSNTPTAADVVELLRSSKDLRELDLLHMGVRRMKEDEIRKLARSAVDTDSNAIRERIISVFNTKRFTWPLDADYLVKWCNEEDADLRNACHRAMIFIADERIRDYALGVLRENLDDDCLMMLIKNFEPGDEELILSLLGKVSDADEDGYRAHDIGSTIRDAYKKLPLSILLWAYEATPCSCCRMYLVEDLIELGNLPESVRNECKWDANLDLRELVSKHENSREKDEIKEERKAVAPDSNASWIYKNVTRQEFEAVKDKVEKILLELGCVEAGTDLPYVQKTTSVLDGNTKVTNSSYRSAYQKGNWYYRVDEVCFPDKPFVSIEFGDYTDLINNTMEDIDPFPYDLIDEDLFEEVKRLIIEE